MVPWSQEQHRQPQAGQWDSWVVAGGVLPLISCLTLCMLLDLCATGASGEMSVRSGHDGARLHCPGCVRGMPRPRGAGRVSAVKAIARPREFKLRACGGEPEVLLRAAAEAALVGENLTGGACLSPGLQLLALEPVAGSVPALETLSRAGLGWRETGQEGWHRCAGPAAGFPCPAWHGTARTSSAPQPPSLGRGGPPGQLVPRAVQRPLPLGEGAVPGGDPRGPASASQCVPGAALRPGCRAVRAPGGGELPPPACVRGGRRAERSGAAGAEEGGCRAPGHIRAAPRAARLGSARPHGAQPLARPVPADLGQVDMGRGAGRGPGPGPGPGLARAQASARRGPRPPPPPPPRAPRQW